MNTLAINSNWWFANATLASLTWLGTVAGFIGLILTYVQARGANKSAKAASEAVAGFTQRITLPDLSYAYAQLDIIKVLVHGASFKPARLVFGNLQRSVLLLCKYFESLKKWEQEVAQARRALRLADHHLGAVNTGSGPEHVEAILIAMRGLSEFLVDREGDIKFPQAGR